MPFHLFFFQPPLLCLLQNLLRVHSIPLSVSLMKMLNSTCPCIDPWGTPLITGFHLGVELLTVTLYMQPSSHSLISRISQTKQRLWLVSITTVPEHH